MILYFDPATKQIFCSEGSDGESGTHMIVDEDRLHEESSGRNVPTSSDFLMEQDFDDDEINAAAHLASTVGPVALCSHVPVMV